MPNRSSMAQKGFLAVLILVVSELGFVSVLTLELHTLGNRLEKERHARQVVEHLNRFTSAAQKTVAEILKALPVAQQVREDLGLGMFKDQLALMRQEMRVLNTLLKDDADSLRLLRQLEVATAEEESSFEFLLSVPHGSIDQAMLAPMNSSGEKLTSVCDKLLQKYQRRDDVTSFTEQSLQRVKITLAVGILIGLVANLLAIMFFMRKVARRISLIADNMSRFARREELLPVQQDNDEIGDIDKAFHRLAEALATAAEQERMLIENATDVVCSIDTRGVFLTVSQAASLQWGYSPERLIGENIEVLLPEGLSDQFEKLNARIAEESDLSFEARLTRKDNVVIDTLWSAHWSPSDGSLFCCIRDITETKQMDNIVAARETQLRTAIENMPVGIVTVDADGMIKSANKIGQALLSLETSSRGRTVAGFLTPLDQTTKVENDSLLHIESSSPLRYAITDGSEGKKIFVDVTSVRSLYRSDETFILLDDVTERHVLEIMKTNLVTLLGTTLHKPLIEVQTIVNGLIDRQAFDESRRARLKRIASNTVRLLGLIEQMLNIESLGVGKLMGAMTPCQLEDVVSDSVESTRDYSEQQRIQLVWDKNDCHATVLGDAQRLVQVVINLISNAIKYSPADTTVSITVIDNLPDLEIRISDQGRGVPEEMREAIFQPFLQTQSSDGRRGAGTGLGLSICKQIIEGHGGKIGVDGKPEGGSVFWIKLPRLTGGVSP
ncbi:PAS domain S-box protein [Candidatus Obscuribacterales bacterium]|nr:PAS domain S-box protein [Candidatus Obscuribacterales bacterium]MBX3153314.1 PAS domain S-box protein [Candidatus Obscuribacterales bacterium]